MALMETWQRVLLGGGIGLVGVGVYFVVRLMQETTDREKSSGWWIGTFMAAAIGMVLAGVADWILRPVKVPTWLRWTIISLSGVISLACVVGLERARSEDEEFLMVIFYFVALFFVFLTIRLFLLEMFAK